MMRLVPESSSARVWQCTEQGIPAPFTTPCWALGKTDHAQGCSGAKEKKGQLIKR